MKTTTIIIRTINNEIKLSNMTKKLNIKVEFMKGHIEGLKLAKAIVKATLTSPVINH